MTKHKTDLYQRCKFIRNKKTEMIPLHKYSYPFLRHLKLAQEHSYRLLLTLWVELNCGKFIWMDMIWKGTHLSEKV